MELGAKHAELEEKTRAAASFKTLFVSDPRSAANWQMNVHCQESHPRTDGQRKRRKTEEETGISGK